MMRRTESGLAALLIFLCVALLSACSEPTKPIKKINIKRASDMEPVQPPESVLREQAEARQAEEAKTEEQAAEIEIVEVQGFRGECDSAFAGISDADLVAMRTSTTIRSFRLAGISIPEQVRLEAHNQIRVWLDRKSVGVEIDNSTPGLDPAAYLYLCPDGMMVNEELVREGLAVPAQGSFRRSDLLKKASVEALSAGRGVWGKQAN